MKGNKNNHSKIWIDICYPPQAIFFIPLINEIRKRGFQVIITVRDVSETCELLEMAGIEYQRIGRHYGKRNFMKGVGIIIRSFQLWHFLRKQHLSQGVSHGSPYQKLVCSIRGVPSLSIADNEHSNWIFAKLSTKVILPQAMPDSVIKVSLDKVVKYPGIKEDVYVNDLKPDEKILDEIGVNPQNIIVTIRPPAVDAHYHNSESEILFSKIMQNFLKRPNLILILLPRVAKDKDSILKTYEDSNQQIIIPNRVVNGLNLMWHSDLVISGGGTMIREAAAMGIPAYSFFTGGRLSVDSYLANSGRLHFLKDEDDIANISIKKRDRTALGLRRNNQVKEFILDQIESMVR